MTTDEVLVWAAQKYGMEHCVRLLAGELGVSPAAIYMWAEYPPPERQIEVQELSKRRLWATSRKRQNGEW